MNRSHEALQQEIIALLPRLRRFARTITRHVDDADDLVQVAVERALKRLDQQRPDGRLDGWMLKIIKNAWIDEVRARVRRDPLFAPEEAGAHVGEGSAEADQQALSIQAAMARLPEEQRLAVSLVLVEGLAYQEAADVLDVPIGTLTSRLSRARDALQAMLA